MGVTVHEDTPAEQAVRTAQAEASVTDARGRTLTLKRPSVLAQFQLVKMVGGAAAENQVYMGMILPLLYLAAIDGEPVRAPATQLQLDALIQRLDEDGITALADGVREHYSTASEDERRAAVKP